MPHPIEYISEVSGLDPVYGPYSTATRAGRQVFVSGRVSRPDLWDDSVGVQTEAVMNDINVVLQNVDPKLGLGNIAMANIYLPQGADFKEFNIAFGKCFDEGRYPARACVRAEAPIDGPDVEISAIAVMSWATWARVVLREKGLFKSKK